MSEQNQKLLHVFKSNIPSSQYIFKSGKYAHFVDGKYFTDIESEIAELEAEIAGRHPHIYKDNGELTIVAEDRDPMVALRKKIIAEHEAQKAAIERGDKDFGNSVQEKGAGMQSSAGLVAAASSTSGVKVGTIKVGSK